MNVPPLEFLNTLNLKPTHKTILLDIIRNGVSSVADISKRLHIPKSTIYDALSPLVSQSLINEYSTDRGRTFGVSDTEQLARVHSERIEHLKKAHASLLHFINKNKSTDTITQPKIKFYAGDLGIKQAYRDMPWIKEHKETYMLWAAKDMVGIDEEFFKWHGRQRFQYNVFIYCIEKHTDIKLQTNKRFDWLKNDRKGNLVEVRYAPKGKDWKMNYWIYGDKVLFSSSGEERIAFIVHSREFAQMMKFMWQSLWNGLKKE